MKFADQMCGLWLYVLIKKKCARVWVDDGDEVGCTLDFLLGDVSGNLSSYRYRYVVDYEMLITSSIKM